LLVLVAARPDEELDCSQLIAGLRRWRTRARHLAEEKEQALDEKAARRASAIALKRQVSALERRVAALESELDSATERIATRSR